MSEINITCENSNLIFYNYVRSDPILNFSFYFDSQLQLIYYDNSIARV